MKRRNNEFYYDLNQILIVSIVYEIEVQEVDSKSKATKKTCKIVYV